MLKMHHPPSFGEVSERLRRKALALLFSLLGSLAVLAAVWLVAQRVFSLDTASSVALSGAVAAIVLAAAIAWLTLVWSRSEPSSPGPVSQAIGHVSAGGIAAQATSGGVAVGSMSGGTVSQGGTGPAAPNRSDSAPLPEAGGSGVTQMIAGVDELIAAQAAAGGVAIGIQSGGVVAAQGSTVHVHPPPVQEKGQIVEGPIPQRPAGFQPRPRIADQLRNPPPGAGPAVLNAVTGIPGVGKTMMAAARAWECQSAAGGWSPGSPPRPRTRS